MRTSTCTRRTSSARELGRGACDLASTGSSVHRYYDPVTAQFTSVDPLVQSTGQPYSYAGGDPVNGVDPLGLSWWDPSWASSAVESAGGFIEHHMGTIATGVAIGALFVPGVDLIDVAIISGAALAARIAQRSIDNHCSPWSSENFGLNVADTIATAGSLGLLSTPAVGAEPLLESLGRGSAQVLRLRLVLPDIFGLGLNQLRSGH